MIIIIDGYNLLRAMHFREKGKLTRERTQLIAQLGQFKAVRGHEILIVFDAGPAMHATREIINGVVVMFSGQGSNADDWILEYVKRESQKEKLLISRDRTLVDMCKNYGTEQLDPEAFYGKVHEVVAAQIATGLQKHKQHGALEKFEDEHTFQTGIDQDALDAAMIEASGGVQAGEEPGEREQRGKSEKIKKKEKKRAKILDKL